MIYLLPAMHAILLSYVDLCMCVYVYILERALQSIMVLCPIK